MNARHDDSDDAITAISKRLVVAASPTPRENRLSMVARLCEWFWRVGANIVESLYRPRLTDHLPALQPFESWETTQVPPRVLRRTGRYEQLLIDILLAPPEYSHAAILMGRTAENLRRNGDDVYAEGVVHFALSRMRPDRDGTVLLSRVRDVLDDLAVPSGILPVLLRLEEHGIVELVTPRDVASTAGVINVHSIRVRLLVLP